jgi:hypothetical protein
LNIANETDFDESKPFFTENFDRSHEANFGNLSQPKIKLAEKRQTPIFENEKLGKLPPLKMLTSANPKLCLKPET